MQKRKVVETDRIFIIDRDEFVNFQYDGAPGVAENRKDPFFPRPKPSFFDTASTARVVQLPGNRF